MTNPVANEASCPSRPTTLTDTSDCLIRLASSGMEETDGAEICESDLSSPDSGCAWTVSGKQKIARNKILTKRPAGGLHFHRVLTFGILLRRLGGNSGVIPKVNQLLTPITRDIARSAANRRVCFSGGIRHAVGLSGKVHFAALCWPRKNVSCLWPLENLRVNAVKFPQASRESS